MKLKSKRIARNHHVISYYKKYYQDMKINLFLTDKNLE